MDPVDSDCAQIVAIYSWMEKPLRAEYEVGPQRFDAVTNVRRKTNIKNAVKYFEKQDPEMLPHERDAILDFLLEAFVKSRADPAYDYDKAVRSLPPLATASIDAWRPDHVLKRVRGGQVPPYDAVRLGQKEPGELRVTLLPLRDNLF